jgi:hypothetical protein
MSFAEAAMVIRRDGIVSYEHIPPGRTAVSLPDSQTLWDHIWATREDVAGVAHLHPGGGMPSPSHEDATTFRAVEQALGRQLDWWILTSDMTAAFVARTISGAAYDYNWLFCIGDFREPTWAARLRALGNTEEKT